MRRCFPGTRRLVTNPNEKANTFDGNDWLSEGLSTTHPDFESVHLKYEYSLYVLDDGLNLSKYSMIQIAFIWQIN